MVIKESTKSYNKGFIRVIEIVIFSFILFVLLMPTFFYYSNINDWNKANGLLLCNDLLYSIEKNKTFDNVLNPFVENSDFSGEHQKDLELLKNITDRVFPVAVDFDYEIKNIAPYEISIGCNCTQSQIDWLNKEILTPSYPTVKFPIKQVSLNNLSSEYNLFIIFDKVNLSKPNIKSNITAMLKKGKGFVLIRNFLSDPDQFTKELFGIDFSGVGFSTNNLSFNNLSTPKTAGIAKRFINNLIRINLSNGKGILQLRNERFEINATKNHVNISDCSLSQGDSCILSGIANITLFQIDPLDIDWVRADFEEWIDLKISGTSNPRDYSFYDTFPLNVNKNNYTILSFGTNAATNAKILKKYSKSYENEPRTFWIYDYNQTKDDLNLLLKTGIIWTSGEHYFVFDKKITDERNYCQHFYSGLDENNIPFLVKLYFFGY